MSVGQQLVSLSYEDQQTFLFKTALPKAGFHQAMVELETDDREGDNRYFFNLHIPEMRNIALISNSQKEYYYIKIIYKNILLIWIKSL